MNPLEAVYKSRQPLVGRGVTKYDAKVMGREGGCENWRHFLGTKSKSRKKTKMEMEKEKEKEK